MLKPNLGENKTRWRKSKKHENRIAETLGGRRLIRSGGTAWSKHDKRTAGGDVKTKGFLIEHKRTEAGSIRVTKDWLRKVSDGARRTMKEPALVLTFEQKFGPPEDWALVPIAVFQRLTGRETS